MELLPFLIYGLQTNCTFLLKGKCMLQDSTSECETHTCCINWAYPLCWPVNWMVFHVPGLHPLCKHGPSFHRETFLDSEHGSGPHTVTIGGPMLDQPGSLTLSLSSIHAAHFSQLNHGHLQPAFCMDFFCRPVYRFLHPLDILSRHVVLTASFWWCKLSNYMVLVRHVVQLHGSGEACCPTTWFGWGIVYIGWGRFGNNIDRVGACLV